MATESITEQNEQELSKQPLPMNKEVSPCPYMEEKECTQLYCMNYWFSDPEIFDQTNPLPSTQIYAFLKLNGFCRYNSVMYLYQCEKCRQCTPIRVPVERFKPSKNQRVAWRKNQDIEVRLEKNPENFVSEERALLYREYEAYHNEGQAGYYKKSIEEALETLKQMNSGYEGIWNLEYRLNGRLVGVSILDYTTDQNDNLNAICSNYFYYEISDEIEQRSIGVFSVLKELELCKELNIPYYYLGLYLAGCKKMNYKINYEPYELLIDDVWISSDFALPEPGEMYEDYPDISMVTKDIELPVLVAGYHQGIFPWFCEEAGEPVIWRSPDPRFVIPMEEMHVSKTLRKFLKHTPYTYTMDKCFDEVMKQCGLMERKGESGTWVGPKMLKAYSEYHKLGYAHSFEVWHDNKLVGGFYGILLGSIFVGESMFTLEDYSSSSAFALFSKAFDQCGGRMIDCQAYTDNMARYGAIEIPRKDYLNYLRKYSRIRLLEDLKLTFQKLAEELHQNK